ncbi:hypothetical protein ES707_08525 [subsurface metagenome]
MITKVDLEPHVDANVGRMEENARSLNPRIKVFQTSARTGKGIDRFADFLLTASPKKG